MLPKVWNKRDPNVPKDAVYVGRPTIYGNPFFVGKHGSREEVVDMYRDLIAVLTPGELMLLKRDLKGKDLVCWCAPKACHADVLLEIANS